MTKSELAQYEKMYELTDVDAITALCLFSQDLPRSEVENTGSSLNSLYLQFQSFKESKFPKITLPTIDQFTFHMMRERFSRLFFSFEESYLSNYKLALQLTNQINEIKKSGDTPDKSLLSQLAAANKSLTWNLDQIKQFGGVLFKYSDKGLDRESRDKNVDKVIASQLSPLEVGQALQEASRRVIDGDYKE